jgi:hypothetical protein
MTLYFYLIISLNIQIWWLLLQYNIESIFRRFRKLLKRKKYKRENEKIRSDRISLHSLLSFYSSPPFLWSFHDGNKKLNFYLVKENKNLKINKIMRFPYLIYTFLSVESISLFTSYFFYLLKPHSCTC